MLSGRIKKISLPISVLIIFLIFAVSGILSGCEHKTAEPLANGLALKLINQKAKISPFFGVLYSKAVSIDNDAFYPALLKNGYIKFNRKLGYTSFTARLKPFLFKKAGKTYIITGRFSIKKLSIKFISEKLAAVSFSFIFQPNPLYRLAKNKNIYFSRLNKIIKSGRAVAVFVFKPYIGWQLVRFKQSSTNS